MRVLVLAAAAAMLAACGGASDKGADRRSRERLSADLRREVTPAALHAQLRTLERIADANGGNRAAGMRGYTAAARYVRAQLAPAGYRVRLLPFPYLRYVEEVERARVVAPTARPFAVEALEYSASTAPGGVRARGVASGDGCERRDFSGGVRGQIALVRRGSCFF